ncbi:hypothetical protein GCM10010149_32980 [Nonomuraea roseoviolacea subsp. roseoviolacea]|uniref:tyrosine-type recombinase/integrase n=1 Tax=Nonomuraea roseoviolacea TaxID=103837 RepID=UPI0031E2BD57
MLGRSVREGGDTKTRKSRRTLAMPKRCAEALKLHRERQDVPKKVAGDRWQDNDLVFASKVGTELDSHNVRRSFRAVLKKAGLNAQEWTPREMRHSFVSMLSDAGMPIEASLAWSGTATPASPERTPPTTQKAASNALEAAFDLGGMFTSRADLGCSRGLEDRFPRSA